MRRALIVLAATAFLAVGCGEDAGQHAARVAVQARAGGARTHCTQTAREYFKLVATKVYLCIVSRADGNCDSWIATRKDRRFDVRLRRRDVECQLPIG